MADKVTSVGEVPGDSCENQEPSGLSVRSTMEKAPKKQLLF